MAEKPESTSTKKIPAPSEVAARCHEIQTGLGLTEVPEFENLRLVGMAVRMALHIQGLPTVNYDTLRLVANHYLAIPSVSVGTVVKILADVEFVKLQTEGKTIKAVIPNVPYYETLYSALGTFAIDEGFNEPEQLSIEILCRLCKSPEKVDALKTTIGAESRLLDRAISIGRDGAYLRVHRSRGRDIALSPSYFSENSEVYADLVAGNGSKQVKKLLTAIQSAQGTPMSIILDKKEIGGIEMSDPELKLLMRLAQDGAVKPPSITTQHSGENFFLFTPRPSGAALSPTMRDVYEKAMAIVSAIRQGQYLAKRYAIRSPGAVLNKLRTELKLGRATTEATQQYQKLVHMRVARLVNVGSGFSELQIIDTRDNREALNIAYAMVSTGVATGIEVDQSAKDALQQDHAYVESLVASGELQKREIVQLSQEQALEMESLFYR
jgi:hypothetical protein